MLFWIELNCIRWIPVWKPGSLAESGYFLVSLTGVVIKEKKVYCIEIEERGIMDNRRVEY